MSRKIRSRNSLWVTEDNGKPMLIDKPRRATAVVYDSDGVPIYKCPNCGDMVHSETECDIIGAEPGCLFCNHCNSEFETL